MCCLPCEPSGYVWVGERARYVGRGGWFVGLYTVKKIVLVLQPKRKVFTFKKIIFKSKNRVFGFKKWVFKIEK